MPRVPVISSRVEVCVGEGLGSMGIRVSTRWDRLSIRWLMAAKCSEHTVAILSMAAAILDRVG